MPANFLLILLFLILGYVWVVRLIERGLGQLDRSTPPPPPARRPVTPPPLPPGVLRPLPPQPPPEPFHPLRWFAREVVGGVEGLAVMRALLLKELRTMLASRKSFWFLFSLSLIASGCFIIFWQNNSLSVTIATRARVSRAIFSSIYLIQFVGLALISTVMASATVTTERENKTLDLLLATRLSREQVILAKWFSNILYQLVLYASLLPIQALTFQLGGVGLDDYLSAAILVCGGIACYGMVGLAVSCHVRHTVTALLGSIGAATAIGLIVPAHNFFSGSNGVLGAPPISAAAYLIPFGFIFLVAWRFAHDGLARRDTSLPAVARPVIDDQHILRQRRETWPFYLIDPLARPQHIADGQNPVYIKEQRISILGRLDIIIRLCYLAMFISFVLVVAEGLSGSFDGFRAMARWEVSFLMLFVPVLAATGISKEHEENTLGLLRATPLAPGRIVWAKYRITMRFLAIVCASLAIVPAVFHVGMSMSGTGFRQAGLASALAANFKIIPSLIAWSAFYAALSLFCSSLCRRNVTAIVASYASMLLLIASPDILGFVAGLVETGTAQTPGLAARASLGLIHAARYYLCPLLSPYYYYADDARGPQGHFFNNWESWPQIIACLLLTALAVAALVEAAKRIMVLRARRA